jgi:ABC-2 type transport system ATP-binding protein
MPVVELEHVTKTYGEVVALDGVDLAVQPGEVVALLGPNGAGKTTLFELLLGLVRPTSGQVQVLADQPADEVRGRVGAMLQNAGVPEQVTVAELVGLVGRSYPAALRLEDVLARVGLDHRRGQTVGTLSGGERQRLLLAMAIVGGPELLLLDEPTAAMDVEGRRAFWEQVRTSVEGGAVTLVFATHDLAEADAVADRVVLLHHGGLIADASPAELKQLVSGCVVRFVTDAPADTIAAWSGIERVDIDPSGVSPGDGLRRLAVSATDAESVVTPLVTAGYHLGELSVAEADLETAFTQLTTSTDRETEPPPAATGGATS